MMNNYLDNKEIRGACCGRPMHYAPQPKCNYNDCCLNEYKYTMPACIRNKQPDCLAKAVIPATTVETVDGITNLANCFVHVTSINTTYYIDDKHRPMIIWVGPVEATWPDNSTEEEINQMLLGNKLGLKSQHIYYRHYSDDDNMYFILDFYYDKTGTPYFVGEFQEIRDQGGLII